jgi:hypothetical protein
MYKGISMREPHWEHGYRCYGYWLENRRIGFIGLSPEHYKPLIVSWTFDIPNDSFEYGIVSNVRKAKQIIEHIYKLKSNA